MSSLPLTKMTAEEFLVWAEDRYENVELIDGRVHAMSPERVRHASAKGETYYALRSAIRAAGLPCDVFVDGLMVRTDQMTMFQPDVLVRCGPPLDADTVEMPDPVIVVEVTSPSTQSRDSGIKLAGYFSVASVAHYLQVDPLKRLAIHHRRDGDEVRSHILASGTLRLDPPGLTVEIEDLFGPTLAERARSHQP